MSTLSANTPAGKPSMEAVFRALCGARAILWRRGEWEWIDQAVDPLQEWADAHGIDPDLAQAIIASENWEDDNG